MEVLKGMSNLSCWKERNQALKLWSMLYNDKLTETAKKYFDWDTAEVYFNTSSGYVFLCDEDYNTIMDDGEGYLDLFISLSYHGNENFLDNLLFDMENGNIGEEDLEELQGYCNEEQKEKYKKYFKDIKD